MSLSRPLLDWAVSVWYVLKEHFIHEISRKGGWFGQRNLSFYDIPFLSISQTSLSPSSLRLIYITTDATEDGDARKFFQDFVFFFFFNCAKMCTVNVIEQHGRPKKHKKSKNTCGNRTKKGRCRMVGGKKSSGSS